MSKIGSFFFSKPRPTVVKFHKYVDSEYDPLHPGRFILPNPDSIVLSQARHPKNSELAKRQAHYNEALVHVKDLHIQGSSRQKRAIAAYERADDFYRMAARISDPTSRDKRLYEYEDGRNTRLAETLNWEIKALLVQQRAALDSLYTAKLEYMKALEGRTMLDYRGRLGIQRGAKPAPYEPPSNVATVDEVPSTTETRRTLMRNDSSSSTLSEMPARPVRLSSDGDESHTHAPHTALPVYDSATELEQSMKTRQISIIAEPNMAGKWRQVRNYWNDRAQRVIS